MVEQKAKKNLLNYTGTVEIKINDQIMFGDCFITESDDTFMIEIFSFGTLIFRLEEKGEKFDVYTPQFEGLYSDRDKIFSLPYLKLKEIILAFLKYNKIDVVDNSMVHIETNSNLDGKNITFIDNNSKNYIKFRIK